MSLDRLWAGWRGEYIASSGDGPSSDCVFCDILASRRPDDETYIVWRHPAATAVAILNAYPYTSGHLLVVPTRHVADLEALSADESAALWAGVTDATRAVKAAYRPEGLNLGANLGRAAGAGVPGHLHIHALPRWTGDTNFTTTVAETRVLPETLSESYRKLRAAWPGGPLDPQVGSVRRG